MLNHLPRQRDLPDGKGRGERAGHAGVDDDGGAVREDHGLCAHGGIHLANAATGEHHATTVQGAEEKFPTAYCLRYDVCHRGAQRLDLDIHGADDANVCAARACPLVCHIPVSPIPCVFIHHFVRIYRLYSDGNIVSHRRGFVKGKTTFFELSDAREGASIAFQKSKQSVKKTSFVTIF